ncbi:aminoglycoside 3-N-acetyltransferase I [Algoriphagus sp. 4150]|uniref:GNAT family N-acetyltransferase n=1 Tax=Algoriphagus sp. 4150 TaxID=2817756 RepID=UPI0028639A9D|nr:GNAT family N-acetyltransferase [Algoriphagus sp. 4150]MDR7130285.1 aminoglycoside 3-N-acetyltransferase I [Algoriphagus sp. 4150]
MLHAIEMKVLMPNEIDEFQELISVFELVFEMENFKRPANSHLQGILAKDSFISIVALHNKKVVAGLTIYLLDQYYSDKKLAYLYDLAVLTEYQRKGIGKQLILFTKEYCKRNGFEELYVQAEKVDDYAIDFYRLTKPTAEDHVVQFSYILKD